MVRMTSLLCSPWLRSAASRLRTDHPALYASLNRLRKKLVTASSGLDLYQHVALQRFSTLTNLRGARVLEIGSDLDLKVLSEMRRLGVAEACGVNNSDEFWSQQTDDAISVSDRIRLLRGDARHLRFEDASFDCVFSVAAFEHILDVAAALREMHRVLKPGGIVYSNFGPLWSSCKGHHVYAVVGEEEARHFKPEKNPLPDFSHLLLSPAQLRASLKGRTSDVLIEPIVAWVYDSTGINRLFYSDYIRIFREAPLTLVSSREERDLVDAQLQRMLRFRYPGEDRFDVTNMEVVFRKSEVPR
jgi:SAM-dependent methyltransferase